MASAATVNAYVARGHSTAGLYRVLPFGITGPASYATGGFACADAELGVTPEVMPNLFITNGSAVRLCVYDYTNKKYVVYIPDTGAEVAAGVDLSGFTGRGVVLGQ